GQPPQTRLGFEHDREPPLPLDATAELFEPTGEGGLRFGALGDRLEIPKERAEVALFGGEQALDVEEALDGRGTGGVPESAGTLDLDHSSSQGLEKPIVEIAGETDPRLGLARRPESLEQAELLHAHRDLARNGLPQDQVVRSGRSDVEEEEPASNRL